MAAAEQAALHLESWVGCVHGMLRPLLNEEHAEGAAPLVGALATHAPALVACHAARLVGALAVCLGRATLFGLVQACLLSCSQPW